MAIILLHNIEHFNLYNFPEATTDFMKALDKGVWDTLFFLFSGRRTLFSPCCSVSASLSSLTTKRGKGRTSGFVSSGGWCSYSLSVASTHRSSRGDLGALFDLGYCVDTGLQVE